MKILTAAQTREADAYTIQQEPVSSLDLMERAAAALVAWLRQRYSAQVPFVFFCGPGNNGGDGLAAARLLFQAGYEVQVFLVEEAGQCKSQDFTQNLQRLPSEISTHTLQAGFGFPEMEFGAIVVDALFGSGLSRPLQGVYAQVAEEINQAGVTVVAVDVPSGLFTDAPTPEDAVVVQATYTVTFERPKLAFLLPKSGAWVGEWHAVPIGLHPEFLQQVATPYQLLTNAYVKSLLKARQKYAHKGTYGHALLIGGSYGKMGALVLAAKAALRAGIGLLTVQIPQVGYSIVQTAVPEAMALTDAHELHFTRFMGQPETYECIGIGPGLGQAEDTRLALENLFRQHLPPLVLDADALNLLAADRTLLRTLPQDTILTPHLKEFERLAGPATDDFHRLQLLQSFCQEHRCYVVLKGAHSCVGTPTGDFYFNTTGNPGMATGGSGDVLTGILTALRAQGHSALETCLLGVYLHGLAGDLAAKEMGQASLIASDLTTYLGKAFLALEAS
ncbi:NAD(P)H-hydrate dehydratase [Nibribacter ruber]|uniref:Bifunctional NAD(P)H-hydrate repair enzyme n=1 Tax=Nibribacter ruber TaxID=2698458 RepID=A0A6P1NZF7_9BACT|nr:NAD(P)H-hydrate dehydratase [Nibribacter ruber]QHL87864.1 NAD(P)H-hydrate dehydratase [Nibribacter ruber]